MMNRVLCAFLCIALGAMSTASAMYDVEHFKALLVAKNYPQIREEVAQTWTEEHSGMRIAWQDGELVLIGTRQPNLFFRGLRRIFYGPGLFTQDVACGNALCDLIITEILHPVMFGTKDLGLAIAELEALSHPFQGSSNGIFGAGTYANPTVHALKVAMCKTRRQNPQRYGVPNHNDVEIQKNADAIIRYVGAQTESNFLWGKTLPFTAKLWANKWYLWASLAALWAAATGYAYFVHAQKNEDETDEENAENFQGAHLPQAERVNTVIHS